MFGLLELGWMFGPLELGWMFEYRRVSLTELPEADQAAPAYPLPNELSLPDGCMPIILALIFSLPPRRSASDVK